MTREEVEKIMGDEPKIQASFEVIGDDVKFIKIIVNGKEKVVNIEELITTYTETCRETDDYENEIEGLQNRLDIAEYDKERLREEVTNLEGKIKALEQEPTTKENLVVEDCISRVELLKAVDTWDRFGCDAGSSKLVPIKDCYVPYIHYDDVVKAIKGMPSIQPKTGHWIATEKDWWKCSECGQVIYSETEQDRREYHAYCGRCGAKMLPTSSKKGVRI